MPEIAEIRAIWVTLKNSRFCLICDVKKLA